MKRLFLFIALFATVWEMKAQSIGAPFRWETTLGLNVSDLGGLGSRTGFHIGARFEIPIFAMNEKTYINAGTILSLKGCSQNHRILGSIKTNPYYLDIPIHFGYRHSITRKVSVFAEAGPYFSIGLFGKHKIEQISATADGGSDPNIVKEDYTENVFGSNGLKRFDFGLGFRIGAELQKRYSVSLGYDWGLIDEYTSDTDKNNGKRLRPAKTVLSQSKGGNSCHNQNQITINGNHRCLQIFQTDRQQHITDSGRENQYEHQNKERRPMERHGEYRSIKSRNERYYYSRYSSTGKSIAQHGYCSDSSQDTLTKNQIDSIHHRT